MTDQMDPPPWGPDELPEAPEGFSPKEYQKELLEGVEGYQPQVRWEEPQRPSYLKLRNWLACGGVSLLLSLCVLSVLVPNTIGGIQKGKQKRSQGEVRQIATALLAYQHDHGFFPQVSDYRTKVALGPFLEPDYLHQVPELDGWGSEYQVWFWLDGEGHEHFQVVSMGRKGSADRHSYPAFLTSPVTTYCFENDIVWQDDTFLVQPSGKQHKCS